MTSSQLEATRTREVDQNWRWREGSGRRVAPREMETRHLFHTLRMIWNNSVPDERMYVGQVKLYSFGGEYTPRFMKEAVVHIYHELRQRKDITDDWMRQLNEMYSWFRDDEFIRVYTLEAPRPALPAPAR